MDIGEVSKRTKLPPSTLRYYEKKGLITPIARHGLRRVYSVNIIERLALITLGRNAGLSLNEISNMLLNDHIKIDRQILETKANELDNKINEMIAMRDGLRHAAACTAENHLACPKFLRLLKIASKRWSKPDHKLTG
ncbi:helix-turn-helix domain-containing protein [uncultured Shewanella sp.]|uniref:helix-turn-helix domain-containing protein n=1 Tax=uncultured Shewanella sp. TaxID=173975 RepID=UPI002607C9B4|nr:helix-turn-helix domain-containing protein [uncultured Shewanella sp.]